MTIDQNVGIQVEHIRRTIIDPKVIAVQPARKKTRVRSLPA
jgi:hypothetical protein